MFGTLSKNTSIYETKHQYMVKYMKEYIGNILQKIDLEIDEIDLYGKNGKLDPLKTDEGDHLKFLLQKSVKLFIGNGV